jgi:FAD/FMN-containing dehydrogenase
MSNRGFSGVVIKLTQLNQLSIDKGVIQVDAGVTLAKLSRFCGYFKFAPIKYSPLCCGTTFL